jgi:hypothetical protein
MWSLTCLKLSSSRSEMDVQPMAVEFLIGVTHSSSSLGPRAPPPASSNASNQEQVNYSEPVNYLVLD